MCYFNLMIRAVFPGTFDPPTNGHLNIIERTCKIFDSLDVVVACNPQKKCLFSEKERLSMMKKLTEHLPNVNVFVWDKLIVDFLKEKKSNVLIRGIRNSNDFAYEFDLSLMNHALCSDVETLFIPTLSEYSIIKSSSIKELAAFGGDISKMVPPLVLELIKEKLS